MSGQVASTLASAEGMKGVASGLKVKEDIVDGRKEVASGLKVWDGDEAVEEDM